MERVTYTPKYGEVSLSVARDGRGVMWSGAPDGAARTGIYEVRLLSSPAKGATSATPRVVIVADLTSLHKADSSGDEKAVQLLDEGRVLLFASPRAEGSPLYRVSLDAVLPPSR